MSALYQGSTFLPRPYQVEARAAVRASWAEHGPDGVNPLLIAATGTGKTLSALFIAQDTLLAGGRVVWLAHRRELLTQPLADLRRHWPHVGGGIVQASRDDAHAQVVFASVDTLRNDHRLAGILRHGHPQLLVVDEAHHSLSPTHRAAIAALRGPETLCLGLTATADREDGKDLSELWEIAYTYGPTEAIEGGWLVPPWAAVSRLAKLDEALAQVPTAGADYDDEQLGRALLLAGIVEHTVAAMGQPHEADRLPYRDDRQQMQAKGRSTMVFCASVEQAERTCAALREAGWDARWVCGTTPDRDRSRLLRLFREGKLEVLVNVTALTEGTDLPVASCAVLARPFKSWSLFVQAVGRVMRLHDPDFGRRCPGEVMNAQHPGYQGKRACLVLDLAGATALHSIVSAPVLIGGSRCVEAPDGQHDYQPAKKSDTKGKCSRCGHTVACLPSVLAGEGSAHDWQDVTPTRDDPVERRCGHCARAQCTRAANGRHVWVHLDSERLTICVECDAEAPYRGDALSSLVGKAKGPVGEDVDWVRVVDVTPETWCADIDGQGLVFVIGDRQSALWLPYWLRRGARSARPLASGPVPRTEVRLRCADLLRRARRLTGSGRPTTERQREYALQLGVDVTACVDAAELSRQIVRAKARQRVLDLGLASDSAASSTSSRSRSAVAP